MRLSLSLSLSLSNAHSTQWTQQRARFEDGNTNVDGIIHEEELEYKRTSDYKAKLWNMQKRLFLHNRVNSNKVINM